MCRTNGYLTLLPNPTLPYFTLPYLTSLYLNLLPYLTLLHLTLPCLTLLCVTLWPFSQSLRMVISNSTVVRTFEGTAWEEPFPTGLCIPQPASATREKHLNSSPHLWSFPRLYFPSFSIWASFRQSLFRRVISHDPIVTPPNPPSTGHRFWPFPKPPFDRS